MPNRHSPKQSGNPLADEEKAFRQQRARLVKQLAGQYVAFYGGRLVDHDKDDEALALRLFRKLGDVAFYIAHINEAPRVFEVPSPELTH
jgi:hypothetical protein